MIALFHAAQQIQNFLQSQNWEFCFIGGIALQRWGEPRMTQDIDISLITGFENVEQYIDAFLDFLPARIEHPKEFAFKSRVLLLKTQAGIGVDIALAGLPFEQNIIDRGSFFRFLEDCNLYTCSAEDLIVMKAFAERGKDWEDVRGIIIRQNNSLDWEYILNHIQPLADIKEAPGIIDQLEKLKNELGG